MRTGSRTAIFYDHDTPTSLLKKYHEADPNVLFFTRRCVDHPRKLEVVYLRPATHITGGFTIFSASEETKTDPESTIKRLLELGVIAKQEGVLAPKDASYAEIFERHQAVFAEEDIQKEKKRLAESRARLFQPTISERTYEIILNAARVADAGVRL